MTPRARRGVFALALVGALGVAGAYLPVGHAEIDAQPTPTSLEIRGTGAMGRLARAVAEQFMKEHEGTIVTVQTCGAHQGLKALVVGTCGMAMGTDELPEELDKLARDTAVKLKRVDLYRDAIVVVVHPSNPVRDLSTRQLRDIFRGATTNWKDVGGADAPIEVLTPATSSASYEVFKRQVLGADAVMTPKAVQVKGRELRAGLPANAIVYVGLAQYVRLNKPESDSGGGRAGATGKGAKGGKDKDGEKEEEIEGDVVVDCVSPPPPAPAGPEAVLAKEAADKTGAARAAPVPAKETGAAAPKVLVQGVSIDGVCPSTATVRAGSYSIVRRMSLYHREPAPPLAEQVLQHFLDPAKGQTLIRKDGNVPVN